MKKLLRIILMGIIMTSFIPTAFGHGLGGEVHPPVTLDGRDVILSIDISPSVFDPTEPERYISINLKEAKNEAVVEHVTYAFEMIKDGEQIFRKLFHDDLGNLTIKTINDNSNEIKIVGDKSPAIEAWMRTATDPVIMTGPIFNSGGLYEYKVEILAVDSDFKFLDKRMELVGAISLAEHSTYDVVDSKQDTHEVSVISYFDTVNNFKYDSDKISFSMPFDWNQDFEQLSVVHQEVRLAEGFSEFLHTKYEAKVNGILLPATVVTIDDYSLDGRTVHMVLNREDLSQIMEQATQQSDSQMHFEIGAGAGAGFPLQAATPDYRYKVQLSWEPEIINAGEDVTFFLQTNEIFTDKTKKNIEYDLELSQEERQIYKERISGNVNTDKVDRFEYRFSPEDVGTIKLAMSEIEGFPLANVSFLVAVNAPDVSKFPMELQSISESNPDEGQYTVDLTLFPNTLDLGEAEFVMSFYQKDTGLTTGDVTYDFVLIKNGTEIHRKSGIANGGGTFENFVFVEREVGDVTIRVENIGGTDEFVELPVNVTPEFPLGVLIIFAMIITMMIVVSKTKLAKNFQIQI
ncbi:blue copper domain-containing protein [Marine Group I thaumarchaeote SCGC AAA799-E16]|uniref:Blue copper domain-containing protein n=5 Tax=Marine Group I TaxID=905826 RepID=A0A087S3F2_9ARCH|nr:blue copper domain-containing protein [Marine Group I thaumarchaeote SCGC AAA799-N04]KER05655.1 blue copper domain-containing protein [Marine Group I thaumarchaeote SCGC AAA799-E16]KFM16178.1 blue copper domain-containing protein [Marine Group I thaumarchaeote SCGC AAA799-D11]KFM16267.1 hypothetical protein SCCGRSA3_02410 [Marine Group I thaumarchaeote SCGC RSA3]KFM20256.1 blue copper domain-containing protein [Marine Group I thaumarchaeote SCGC AAA799-P11]